MTAHSLYNQTKSDYVSLKKSSGKIRECWKLEKGFPFGHASFKTMSDDEAAAKVHNLNYSRGLSPTFGRKNNLSAELDDDYYTILGRFVDGVSRQIHAKFPLIDGTLTIQQYILKQTQGKKVILIDYANLLHSTMFTNAFQTISQKYGQTDGNYDTILDDFVKEISALSNYYFIISTNIRRSSYENILKKNRNPSNFCILNFECTVVSDCGRFFGKNEIDDHTLMYVYILLKLHGIESYIMSKDQYCWVIVNGIYIKVLQDQYLSFASDIIGRDRSRMITDIDAICRDITNYGSPNRAIFTNIGNKLDIQIDNYEKLFQIYKASAISPSRSPPTSPIEPQRPQYKPIPNAVSAEDLEKELQAQAMPNAVSAEDLEKELYAQTPAQSSPLSQSPSPSPSRFPIQPSFSQPVYQPDPMLLALDALRKQIAQFEELSKIVQLTDEQYAIYKIFYDQYQAGYNEYLRTHQF